MRKSKDKSPSSDRSKARSFSTSEGRANLARALAITDREKTIVGFDRYRRPVAALVPIDAVRMLAGESIEPSIRDRISRMARMFVSGMPEVAEEAPKAAKPAKKAKKAPAKKATAKRGPPRRSRR